MQFCLIVLSQNNNKFGYNQFLSNVAFLRKILRYKKTLEILLWEFQHLLLRILVYINIAVMEFYDEFFTFD